MKGNTGEGDINVARAESYESMSAYGFVRVYIYIYMLPPLSDLPFVAFIAWKPPELLK